MSEQERLRLTSTVEDDFSEDLESLESLLEDVDDQIRETGRGNDYVRIDVETSSEDAIAEVEELNAALETLDDDVTIDVDTDYSDVLREGVDVDSRLRGSQFRDTETGRPVSAKDAIGRQFSEISGAIEEEMGTVKTVDIDAGHVDIDSPSVTGGGSSAKELVTSGGYADFIDKDPDSRLPSGVSIGGFETPNAVNGDRMEELMADLFDERVRPDVGELGGNDYARSSRTTGLVAEGIPSGEIEVDLVKAQKRALDEMDDAVDKFDLEESFQDLKDLRFGMGNFYNIFAAMIPLFGVFVGAIPAVITALGGLATAAIGAMGALAGIGALGAAGYSLAQTGKYSMKPLKERLRETVSTYEDAFAPLARSFGPTFERMVDNIESMAGPLANASSNLITLRDEFVGFSQWLSSAIPSFVGDFIQFSEAMMPTLKGIGNWISDVDIFGVLAETVHDTLPLLIMMGKGIKNILPFLLQMSKGFLHLASVIVGAIGILTSLINRFPLLSKMLGIAISGTLTLIAATSLYSAITGTAIKTLLKFSAALGSYFIKNVGGAIASLLSYTYSLDIAQASTWGLYIATAAFLTLITFGIAVIPALAQKFNILGSSIKSTRKELEKFANTKNALNSDVGLGNYGSNSVRGGDQQPYVDNSTIVIDASNRDDAARQQYSSQFEHSQHVDSVFGSG